MAVPHGYGEEETMTPSEPTQRSPDLPASASPMAHVGTCRTVTASQVTNAITQLRVRRGLSAAMQIQALLRAFDLTVVPDPQEHPPDRSEGSMSAGPCAACLAWLSGARRPGRHTCW